MSYNEPCDAMEEAGIEDAHSRRGIRFCINDCPYSCCVVAEPRQLGNVKTIEKKARIIEAKELRHRGFDVDKIAIELGVNTKTIQRYLKYYEVQNED